MSWTDTVAGPDLEPEAPRHGDPRLAVATFPMKERGGWVDERPQWQRVEPPTAPPFCWSRNSDYYHRTRYLIVYPNWPGGPRIHVTPWCGSSGGRLLSDHPDPDRTMCGTCHGRAIGAGQIDHEGTPLIFTPSSYGDLGRCVWIISSYHWAGGGSDAQCRNTARHPVEEIPGAGVCNQHHRSWPPAHRRKRELVLDTARAQTQRRAARVGAARLSLLGVVDTIDPMEFWS